MAENRNIGSVRKRITSGNVWSVSCVAENALNGAATDTAHRTAAGTASTAHGERMAPTITATIRKARLETARRMAIHTRLPT